MIKKIVDTIVIEKFETKDGKVFSSEHDALIHENRGFLLTNVFANLGSSVGVRERAADAVVNNLTSIVRHFMMEGVITTDFLNGISDEMTKETEGEESSEDTEKTTLPESAAQVLSLMKTEGDPKTEEVQTELSVDDIMTELRSIKANGVMVNSIHEIGLINGGYVIKEADAIKLTKRGHGKLTATDRHAAARRA